jgi:beta-galactosidase/beta-glucuronidase
MNQTKKFKPSIINYCCQNQSLKIVKELIEDINDLIKTSTEQMEADTLKMIKNMLFDKQEEIMDRYMQSKSF